MRGEEANAWLIPGAVKDRQTVTAQWSPCSQALIAGVTVKEITNVPKMGGYLSEIVRAEWLGANTKIDQVFQTVVEPGSISAWHAHAHTTDRLFVSQGLARIVLYDTRPDSPTLGLVNEMQFGTIRPALVCVPPQVWHGVQNVGSSQMVLLNIVDSAYCYSDPDHWRLPEDCPDIPFKFNRRD
jgi:dTDP-4-dehydrorhamnose 3,5-epimerase